MVNDNWWKSGIIYQIYPRSFKDSNGDGIGDLQGIIEKLDYLKELGITAIWLSPIYTSPMVDFGYDVKDFIDIDPIFGTLDDFKILLQEAHARNIKIIMDYVANHTSDQHPWFLESKKSRNNPKSDYYIWKDPKPDGSVPNNWICVPGFSAWEWCEERQQYYYHSFLKTNADVNWANPELRKEMLAILRFWLDLGVDGFRIDMVSWLYKDPEWRDNPINPDYNPETDFKFQQVIPLYTIGQEGLFTYLKMISDTVNAYENKLIIGETLYETPLEDYWKYYGTDGNLVHIPGFFKFLLIPWTRKEIFFTTTNYFKLLPSYGWPNFQFGNHDVSRMATRLGGRQIARVAAIFLLTLKGTPFIYNGEEIGMIDGTIPSESVKDPTAKHDPKLSRDPYRTPMLWNSSRNAGFSSITPWLPINDDYKEFNVENELKDKNSFLILYKKLILLRNTHEALQIGEITFFNQENTNCICYNRLKNLKEEFGILINFSNEKQEITMNKQFTVLFNSFLDEKTLIKGSTIILRNNEALILSYTKK